MIYKLFEKDDNHMFACYVNTILNMIYIQFKLKILFIKVTNNF